MVIGHEIVGSGPNKVLVLHGWFGDHTIWSEAASYFDRERFCYALPDYRGYGRSKAMAGEHTMREIADDALALADHLGWDRFSVVGHSMGGMAAQRIAVDVPERVQSLVCITPVPASGVPMPPEIAAVFARVATDDDAARNIISGSLGRRLSPTVTEHILEFTRRTTTSAAMTGYGLAFTQTDFSAEARHLKTPMLVLVGEHDGGVSPDFVASTFPTLYRHAQFETLMNSGHYPMLEVAPWLVTLIEGFIAEQLAPRHPSHPSPRAADARTT
jgi:pimeloyl-ACP methyl ester carboxylesterase